jgi:hypothetical protein
MRKLIPAIAAAALAALPAVAFAQSGGWISQQNGNHQFYEGTGDNAGWSGISSQQGNATSSQFRGPQGQTYSCMSFRAGDRVHTTCN